jgi:hypothetical protein
MCIREGIIIGVPEREVLPDKTVLLLDVTLIYGTACLPVIIGDTQSQGLIVHKDAH